jgi:hypothetical protein
MSDVDRTGDVPNATPQDSAPAVPPDQERATPFQPITVLLACSSIAATIWWWSGGDAETLMLDFRVWREPWRLISSVLLHADLIHLVFNIYWLGLFGARTYPGDFTPIASTEMSSFCGWP